MEHTNVQDGVFLPQKQSTNSPNEKGRSPNGWETYNNIKKIVIINNNNKDDFSAKIMPTTKSTELSHNCSVASQNIHRKGTSQGYRADPITLPTKVKEKIHRTVHEMKTISNPSEVIEEGEFAVARCFTGKTMEHAVNTFCKLLRKDRWSTPIPLRMIKNVGNSEIANGER